MKNILHISIIAVVVALGTSLKPDAIEAGNLGMIMHQIEQHDADIKGDIATHDGNMTNEHNALSAEHSGLATKLDEIETALGGVSGGCPDCPDAWDKLLTTERFELVMNGEAVLDKETCLVWEQSPDPTPRTWTSAIASCYGREIGGRKGWHLPTVEQLTSLVDSTQSSPSLPSGHPFSDVRSSPYWSSTTSASNTSNAWVVGFISGNVGVNIKVSSSSVFVWCVRGGQTNDGY